LPYGAGAIFPFSNFITEPGEKVMAFAGGKIPSTRKAEGKKHNARTVSKAGGK
jgi:hypothetical protein